MNPKEDLFINSFYDPMNDRLGLIMKNVEKDIKTCKIIEHPKLTVYKYNKPTKHFMDYVLLRDCTPVNISYKWKSSAIAELIGIDKNTYHKVVKNDRKKSKLISLNKNIFGVDINIEDQMLMKYMDSFPHSLGEDGYDKYEDIPPMRNIHKSYADAEWDIMQSEEPEEQPIYLYTYVDGKSKISYTYYLYNPDYNGIDELDTFEGKNKMMQRIKNNMLEHIKDLNLPEDKKVKVYPILKDIAERMTYVIKRYDDEEAMLRDIWQLMYREYKPDFLEFYNARADISQTMLRYESFGGDCKDLFTCPEIGDWYDMDMSDLRFEPNERNDTYNSASYTKLICSFQKYHTLRKTERYAKKSLNDVALREIGLGKLEYKHICSHIRELPYKDFLTAMEYNIRDVVLMDFLESCLNDLDYLMSLRFLKTVDYDRVFIPMAGVYSVMFHISLRNGKIMGNNVNRILNGLTQEELDYFDKRDPYISRLARDIQSATKIEGGLCSEPTRFKGKNRKGMLSFLASLVLKHTIDIDATSEYPNAIITGMMGRSRIYGRIKAIDDEKISGVDVHSYMQPIINRDYISTCNMFYNLPSTTEIISKIMHYNFKEIKKQNTSKYSIDKFVSLCNKNKYTELNKILSKILNPKQDQKDLEIGETALRGIYVLGRSEEISLKYFGTKVSYVIKNKDGVKIPALEYLEYQKDDEYIFVDTVSKEIDNGRYAELRPDNAEVLSDDSVLFKPLKYIDTVDITNQIYDITNPNKLMKSGISCHDTYVNFASRTIAYPRALVVNGLHKSIKSTTALPKGDVVYITPDTIPTFKLLTDSISFENIEPDENGLYAVDNGLLSVKLKSKTRNIKFKTIETKYHLYQVCDIEEDNIYKGIIEYNMPLDLDHDITVSQEMFFVNYINYKK